MIAVMSIAIMTALMIAAAFITYDISSTKRSTIEELNLISNIIGKRTAPAMQFSSLTNKDKASENLADVSNKQSIVLACVYKKDGEIFASYHRQGSSDQCPVQLPKIGHSITSNSVNVFQEIVSISNQPVGFILVSSDLKEVHQHVLWFVTGVSGFLMIVLVLAYALANKMQKIISLPILELTKIASRITEDKDYSLRAPLFYRDELGILVESINVMLSEIQKRDQELLNANMHLEDKVKERTRQLEDLLEELRAALQVKSDFLANMNHEIRTPIHGVRNFIRFLVEDWDTLDDMGRKSLAIKTQTASERLLLLINNLLDLAKLGEKKMEFDKQLGLLSPLVEQILLESEGLARAKHITIIFEKPIGEQEFYFDQGRVGQVITNLVGNAVKYSNNGTITLRIIQASIESDDKQAIDGIGLSISDQGIGIPPNELAYIFEKFAESSRTKTKAGGTGLGLAICKEILQAHGGKIWAENNKEKGSTFTFLLPLSRSIQDTPPHTQS